MKKARAKRKQKMSWTWWFLITAMILACGCVGIAFWSSNELTSEKIIAREFQSIAERYYEEYLYPNFVTENPDSSELFEKLSASGFAAIRLRQLLNYAGNEKRDSFINGNFTCDTNKSFVIFIPEKPFGPKNYSARYTLACE